LSLIDAVTFQELSKCLALKYRTVHKIIFDQKTGFITVFGQKAINILRLDADNKFQSALSDIYIELDDWIFDLCPVSVDRLVIVCAHNQCILYGLNERRIKKTFYCDQKCML
jgi:hypothetical protein